MKFRTAMPRRAATAFVWMLLPALGLFPGAVDAAQGAAAEGAAEAEFFRNHYFPNTEVLAGNEMRVIALGTGMPGLRKSQASSSWFVELGNGDKFFFDLGTASQSNFAMLQVPLEQANKVFLSHLHIDHAGDLDALWIGGWVAGRYEQPLRVWGPSGLTPELGTRHFLEMMQKTWRWDIVSRHGKMPAAGAELEINEFDYAKAQTVYAENDVKIAAFPAPHVMDGAVSYKLEWSGLSFVYSGDTAASALYVENAKGADLSVHETFPLPAHLRERFGWNDQMADFIGNVMHTSPEAAGEVFALTKPRLAVGTHFYNDFDTAQEVQAAVRSTYDGPLALARDGMAWCSTSPRRTSGCACWWGRSTPTCKQYRRNNSWSWSGSPEQDCRTGCATACCSSRTAWSWSRRD